jgi:hypothetical protein
MATTTEARGVCLACKHDPGCIWEAFSGRTILQCEQFELGFLPAYAQPASAARTASRAMPRNGDDSANYAGLCSNCENRETCIYPKPEGGVWRCDEYV